MGRFGHAMREHFALDPGITYLNHGTVGAPPRRVLAVQQAIRDEIELQPSRYLLRELSEIRVGAPRAEPPRLRTAAAEVAAFFGARGEDVVFVDNATTGANAVLRSLSLAPGDEILLTSLGYGAITNVASYVARRQGATVRTVSIPPATERPEDVVEAIDAALGDRTRLAIVDHIASDSALLLPVAEVAALCRARGVPIFVDGAHAPGAIALDLPAIGADWYVGNLHKWAWAPRSTAILWVRPELQAALHPPVISWGLDQGFTTEFDLVGTRDPSAWLAAPAALELLAEFGAEEVRAYNHELAFLAGDRLAKRWKTEFRTPRSMVASMVSVPLPERFGGSDVSEAQRRGCGTSCCSRTASSSISRIAATTSPPGWRSRSTTTWPMSIASARRLRNAGKGTDLMRRLLLLSNSTNHGERYLAHAAEELLDLLGDRRRILFVPFALHDRAAYAAKFRARLEELGCAVDELAADATGRRQIETAESVFVGGGNTFRLLKILQEADLLAPLRERALGGMPYLGASAGINLAGPTIRTTNDMPIVEPRGFDALGLVPFQINPHYLDADPASTHMGETRADRIAEFHEENATPVVGLRERAWIRVEGPRAWLGGERGARIFRRGSAAEERETGASLDDLLV